MKKSRQTKRLLITLGCCCILAAAALSAYNMRTASQAAASAAALTDKMAAVLQAAVQPAPEQAEGFDPGLSELGSPEEGEDEIAVIAVDGYNICGIVTFPTLGIELAVISDWSYPALQVSACRYSGTGAGQLILMAHNYSHHFGRLKELSPGDTVQFTAADGTMYTYEVTGTENWATDQLREIISGEGWDLTLFTCTYGGANRVVVRCVRV